MIGQFGQNTVLWCSLWTLWSVLHFSAVRQNTVLWCSLWTSWSVLHFSAVRSAAWLCCVMCVCIPVNSCAV